MTATFSAARYLPRGSPYATLAMGQGETVDKKLDEHVKSG
jgi:hypothetical protein